MRIRMLMNVGVFHNMDDVKTGDILDVPAQVDAANAARYCALGYCEEVTPGTIEEAIPPVPEQATLSPEPRRRRGRPPKQQQPSMMAATM